MSEKSAFKEIQPISFHVGSFWRSLLLYFICPVVNMPKCSFVQNQTFSPFNDTTEADWTAAIQISLKQLTLENLTPKNDFDADSGRPLEVISVLN